MVFRVFWSWSPSTILILSISSLFWWIGAISCLVYMRIEYGSFTLDIASIHWIERVKKIWLNVKELNIVGRLMTGARLNRLQHGVKFARMNIIIFLLFLHLVDNFMDGGLLYFRLPKFKNSFISFFRCFFSEVVSGLSWIISFERIFQEIKTFQHHYLRLLLASHVWILIYGWETIVYRLVCFA